MINTLDNALANGYAVDWAADISEKGFSYRKGVAIVPSDDINDLPAGDREKWDKLSKKEKDALIYTFENPKPEKKITQEIRQEGFDNYTTTDDHGMEICGTFKDQNGTKYYKIKNSWGTDNSKYIGYFFASETYMRYKTIAIIVNKKAIPSSILKKIENK